MSYVTETVAKSLAQRIAEIREMRIKIQEYERLILWMWDHGPASLSLLPDDLQETARRILPFTDGEFGGRNV